MFPLLQIKQIEELIMTKDVSCDPDYRHTFTDASHLLNKICRQHYSLKYEEWKEIFDDILEQVYFDEAVHKVFIQTLSEEEQEDEDDALSYFQRLAKGA